MISSKAVLFLVFTAASAGIPRAQSLGGCPVLPANNVWNTPVDALPVHPNSAAYVQTVGTAKGLHPDFSSTGYGIPFVVVPGSQPKVPVTFDYSDESDPGPYPIPPNAPIEGGASSTGDRHVLVLENTNCILYELFYAFPQANGSWRAGSGAVFDLKTNALRPAGWTSADAAGLPILPGLVRYDEVASGEIRHAIRMTAPQTRREYIWPARHYASSLTGTQYPPMGLRFRLKASFDIAPYPADVQVILRALKKYGAILSDNGSSWYLTGAPDPRWNDDTLHRLGQVLGSNFEAVDESGLMVDPNSGAVSTVLALNSVQVNPAQITGGASSSTNQVTLTGPAPAVGVTVTLSSSNAAVASTPASVLVPGGATSAGFTISTTPVTAATPVTITASYSGATRTATLTVNAAPAVAALTGLSIAPASVTGGGSATGTVTLSGAAPPGGAAVALSEADDAVTVPGTVTVAAGATSTTFAVATAAVTAPRTVTVTASYGGVGKTATLTVNPPAPTGSYTLQAPSSARRNSRVTVQWTAPAGHSGNDRVALYSGSGTEVWSRTTGTGTSGSFAVRMSWPRGQYSLRLARADGPVAAQRAITVY
jgi:hypothetical protein